MKILITGLSGSGKTTLTKALIKLIPNCITINGDTIRENRNDNDFSLNGRLVQAVRMKNIAGHYKEQILIADFICPTEETRRIFNADYVIFMNTIKSSQYSDTDALYETPTKVDVEVRTKDADNWALLIRADLRIKFPKLFDIPPKT
ncbi:hypothetical protein LCGC14_1313970 [marine sediment metagenome]|uniref:APS kinase domain-containing protein n=1 Tax=marine sediment metagenome TaxID=412755 RepID=A0A0F9NNW8_9ZZZZ